MKVEVSVNIENNGNKKFILEERRYKNKSIFSGLDMQLTKVSNVGSFNTREEAVLEKKRLLKKKHENYTRMYKIREV